MTLAVLIGGLILLSLLGVPLAFAILGACLLTLTIFRPHLPLELMAQHVVNGIDSFPLIAIALFLFAGELMNAGGITRRIVEFAATLVGHIRGGLGHVTVLASMIISGISGSAVADAAATGSVMVPAMKRAGFPPAFSAALCETAAVMGPIIPPSIPMVIYAILVEASVGKMFVGGVIPGILMGLLLMVMVWIISHRRGYAKGQWGGLGAIAAAFVAAIAALATPVIILGGILGGVFTVTEAGAIACAYCALVALLVYRQLSWAEFKRSLVTAAQGTASVMVIVGASGLMGWMIADMQINKEAAALLLSVTDVDWIFLTLVNVFFLIVGMFMDPLAALIVFVPILMPAVSALGIDVVHFGVVIVINLMIGLCTPPVGYLIYLMANVAGEPPQAIIRESLPFLGVLLLVLVLVTYIPSLTLALPALILG
jgi:tripartite ATP-independent transporter DctM subunit